MKNLFSLLLGKELSIENIWLIPKRKYNYQAFYFTSFNAKKDPLRNHLDATCSFSTLIKWGLWETIIKNFFNIKEFRNIWSRLASAYGNNGLYWDYKILSCVVILEMYCKDKSSGKGIKLEPSKFSDVKCKLNNVLDEIAKDKTFSESDIKVIDGFKVAVSDIKNTTHPTLQEKFDYLLSLTNSDMRAAISFSEKDFKIMKKIRNSVAHGLDYKPVKAEDISIEMQIKDRLLMLLTYFSYRDLGFNDIQIIKCFRHNFNSFLLNGRGDKKIIDKLSGDVQFIELINSVIDKDHPIMHCIAVDKIGELYQLNEKLTNELLRNPTWGKHSDIRIFMQSMLDQNDGHQVEYLNQAYLKSNGVEKLYHGVIMISAQ